MKSLTAYRNAVADLYADFTSAPPSPAKIRVIAGASKWPAVGDAATLTPDQIAAILQFLSEPPVSCEEALRLWAATSLVQDAPLFVGAAYGRSIAEAARATRRALGIPEPAEPSNP